MDPVRDARVPRPGDHPQQGLQQGGRLVGAGGTHVRDGGRVPALLRGPAHTDLREDRLGKGECICKVMYLGMCAIRARALVAV